MEGMTEWLGDWVALVRRGHSEKIRGGVWAATWCCCWSAKALGKAGCWDGGQRHAFCFPQVGFQVPAVQPSRVSGRERSHLGRELGRLKVKSKKLGFFTWWSFLPSHEDPCEISVGECGDEDGEPQSRPGPMGSCSESAGREERRWGGLL